MHGYWATRFYTFLKIGPDKDQAGELSEVRKAQKSLLESQKGPGLLGNNISHTRQHYTVIASGIRSK